MKEKGHSTIDTQSVPESRQAERVATDAAKESKPLLTISNKYVFAEVMRNKTICKGFLQRVLPEISIGEIVYIRSTPLCANPM